MADGVSKWLAVMTLVVLVLVTGCDDGAAPGAGSTEEVPTAALLSACRDGDADASSKVRAVALGAEDHGITVELEPGQSLEVSLDSNPTTGYRWEVAEIHEAVLRQVGESEFVMADERDPPPPGAGGTEIFCFEALGKGRTPLTLIYHRPWEQGVDPIETFWVETVVR
jgi:inhibitor of cysteine peptidase